MTKEEMIANLEENRTSEVGVGNFTNLAYFAFGNPVTDSMVVNAYAKTNVTAFKFALETGAGYGNHSFAGGNMIYNFLYNRKFTGQTLGIRNWASKSIRPFEHIPILNKSKILKNFSFNFVSSKELDGAGSIVSEFSKKTGLDKTSEIVRTGFGFGRNYNDFFKALKGMGFDVDNFLKDGATYFFDTTDKKGFINSKVAHFIRHADDEVIEGVSKFLDARQIKNLNKIRSGSKKVANDAVVKAVETFLDAGKTSSWNKSNFSFRMLDFLKGVKDKTKILDLAESLEKTGVKLKHFNSGITKEVTEELIEEIAEKAGVKFASRTMFEKILSNQFVRIATGAAIALPAAVSIPLTIATTAAGIVASAGQENAVNNFLNSHLYNTNQFDNYTSEEATASIYSASHIRDVNLQTIYNSYAKINVANRYLNDLAPISSDYSFELEDAETI